MAVGDLSDFHSFLVRLLVLEGKERDFGEGLHKAECGGSSRCRYAYEGACSEEGRL